MWIKDGTVTEYIEEAKDIPNGEYLTVKEYSEASNIPEATVRSWIQRGQIEHYILHQQLCIPAGSVPKRRVCIFKNAECDKKSVTKIKNVTKV